MQTQDKLPQVTFFMAWPLTPFEIVTVLLIVSSLFQTIVAGPCAIIAPTSVVFSYRFPAGVPILVPLVTDLTRRILALQTLIYA